MQTLISHFYAEIRYVKLIENRVCRIMGEVLLRSNPQFALTEFLKPWQDSVPEGMSKHALFFAL